MRDQIRNDYKNWLIGLTSNWCSDIYGVSYVRLMEYLYSVDFTSIYPNDCNRVQDGIEMRFRFIEAIEGVSKLKYTYHDVYRHLTHACNMLEMMTALAQKCEDHIMGDPEVGDRSGEWFCGMLKNTHLDRYSDEYYDEYMVSRIVSNVIDHNYCRNGDGGLFSIKNPDLDMRNAELWYQMNWYLGELYDQY